MNANQLKSRASRLLNRLTALDFTCKGKTPVLDQAYELVAAEDGFRNQHALRAKFEGPAVAAKAEAEGLKQWHAACNQAGWNRDSEIIHLEGFIAQQGLMAAFGAYAAAAAKEEWDLCCDDSSGRVAEVLREVGYDVKRSDFKQPYWEFDDAASTDFTTEAEAWADAWEDAQHRVTGKLGVAPTIWAAMTEEARLAVVRKNLESAIDRKYRLADDAYENYDFGAKVAAANGWETSSNSGTMVRTVFLEDENPEAPSIRVRFTVELVDGKVADITVSCNI